MKKTADTGITYPTFVLRTGELALRFLELNGQYGRFVWAVLCRTLTPPWRLRAVAEQCIVIGIRSLPIAVLTSIFVGMVMVLQTGVQLAKFGAKGYVPGISFIANAREMVPAFVAIVVGARVAASITAEIGTMKVTEQLDAMDTLNVDPVRYLAVPRLIAMTVMLPLISALCLVTGFLGGMVVGATSLNIDPLSYYHITLRFAYLEDVYGGLFKTIIFGMIIALTGCFYGFFTSGGAAGVGRATTNSVVSTLILILIFDYILTTWILIVTGVA